MKKTVKLILGAIALAALAFCLVLLVRGVMAETGAAAPVGRFPAAVDSDGGGTADASAAVRVSATMEPSPTPAPTPWPDFEPVRTRSKVITETKYMIGDKETKGYKADEEHIIDFGGPEDFTPLTGITTFRGNNFRNTASYGTAQLNAAVFGEYWTVETSMLDGWGGSGWTGQPLAVKWPEETKQIMDMYDRAKKKKDLVEVIYATLGGRVYFIDLETGEKTRDDLYLGYTFKGAGSIDPRGYPLMYLGGGVSGPNGAPGLMVVSLIDGEVLYTTGSSDSFAPRNWPAWDGAPLLDAETDQLIYPGENGVIYLLDLNTDYDPEAGTISVDPKVVKFTFTTSAPDYWYYGMEDSAIAWRGHLFVADNRGDFVCIDLNTLQIEWNFDCLDDTNCTGVLEVDDTGHPYIYLSTSFHLGWRSSGTAEVPVWKIDAVTGKEVWHQSYDCYSVKDLSGGVLGSLALGTGPLEGIVYVAMARYPSIDSGWLVALDAQTGEELWHVESGSYSWSSPVCFYDTDGNGYVLYTSCLSGSMYLVEGLTGKVCDKFDFDCTMEASPIVWNNTVVIGTRGQQIYGITLE